MVNRRSMECVKVAAAGFLVASCLCFSSPLFAQTEVDAMPFEELIGAAKTEYEAENYDAAITYLLAANRKQPNARLLLNVAKSYEKSGDCVKAQAYYRAFVRDPEAEAGLVRDAKSSIQESSQCEGWDDLMSGRLQLSSTPSGATVIIDGDEVGTTPTEVAGLMEGTHDVSFVLEGYERSEETVDLLPERDKELAVTLTEVPQQVVAEPESEPEPQPEPVADTGTSPVVHYAVAGGIGAVGLGLFTAGLITDLGIPNKYDEPRRDPGLSDSEHARLTEERKGATTRAMIFYISGGVLIAAGVGYAAFVATTMGEEEPPPTLSFVPSVGPDGIGVVLSGAF